MTRFAIGSKLSPLVLFAYTHAIFPVSYILTEDHDELAIQWKSDGGFYFHIGSSYVTLESTKKDNFWLK